MTDLSSKGDSSPAASPDHHLHKVNGTKSDWWRGAVIYQIYPRSMKDTKGDGVGDLPGITENLDYVASLGVDAIWISPFFKSPMKDFGYDISDYRAIDPLFGCMDDFDQLVDRAHKLGLKVIIDQVLSHTSDQHDWFQESRSSTNNPMADWYVWADAKADGSPPNNWLSIFGGPAWHWDTSRRQYYLHNFLETQPDLNFHHPEVKLQILQEVEFWLKKGVDGLRLDAINFCFHDKQLRDNPAKSLDNFTGRGFREDNPYAYQAHLYDITQPENLEFLESLRALLEQYPGSVSLGEISAEDTLKTMAEYVSGDKRLHMGYSFTLLTDEFSTTNIRQAVESLESTLTDGWPCWSLGNHDVARVLSRWGGQHPGEQLAKVLNGFLFSLRGSICSYQGEELGLTEADIDKDQLQDPYGIAFWPMFKGRDGCRTPMPWTSDVKAGFTQVKPWLPIPESHRNKSVTLQDADPDSVLNAYRTFLAWRKSQSAIQNGAIEFIDSPEGSLAFMRTDDSSSIVACFNFTNASQQIHLTGSPTPLQGHGFEPVKLEENQVTLPSYSAFFGQL